MAAEVVVPYVVTKLGDLLIQEAVFLHGVTEEVQWLHRELSLMQAFLKDADGKKLKDERVKNWVKEVRDVAYDVEDVIDSYIYRKQRLRRGDWMGVMRRYACFCNELFVRRELLKDIESRKLKIKDLLSIGESRLGIKEDLDAAAEGTSRADQSFQHMRRFNAFLVQQDVVGFGEDMAVMVNRLITGEPRLSVVSIVGIGGLGKSTLAQMVYNSDEVKHHFSFRCFIYVSQNCILREVFHTIIRCFEKPDEEIEKMGEILLAEKIYYFLKNERYLIVLDDIWRRDDWDRLRCALPNTMTGSRVMLTTRVQEVASYADPLSTPYYLHQLDDSESWNLFRKKVFVREDTELSFPSQLEEVGRQIVKRCGGLPLAIVALAGLLGTKDRTVHNWLQVLRNLDVDLSDDKSPILHTLQLSYRDLPHYLKSCLLYIGLFPEDVDIPAEKLVRLWVAEGFVQDDGRVAEDVGQDYLEELINRNMVQVAKRRSFDRKLVKCRMHNLMRDLCISEAKHNRLFELHGLYTDYNEPLIHVRRLVTSPGLQYFPEFSAPRLRSLLPFGPCYDVQLRFRNMKFLRILDLKCITFMFKFPSEICQLILLRYLAVQTRKEIPSSMSNLSNLQVLEASYTEVHRLSPNVYQNMKQLRRLTLQSADVAGLRLEDLCYLQTLSVRECKGTMKGLKKLTNLRELFLHGHSEFYVPEVSFEQHHHLNYMHLYGRLELPEQPHLYPPNLAKLTYASTTSTRLSKFILPTLEKLPNLQTLDLQLWSVGKEISISSGGFPRLQVLKLKNLFDLKEWKVERGALPALQRLKIFSCSKLEKLPEGLQNLISLKELQVKKMPLHFNARLQENDGADWHEIKHIRFIVIKG